MSDLLRIRVLGALDALLALRCTRVRVSQSLRTAQASRLSADDLGTLVDTTDAVLDLDQGLWGTVSETAIDDWLSLSETRVFGDGLLYCRSNSGGLDQEEGHSLAEIADLDASLWSVEVDQGVRDSAADLLGAHGKLRWLRTALANGVCQLAIVEEVAGRLTVHSVIPALLAKQPEQTLLTDRGAIDLIAEIENDMVDRLRLRPQGGGDAISLEISFSAMGRPTKLERPAPEACRPMLLPVSTHITGLNLLRSRRLLSLDLAGRAEIADLFWAPESARYSYQPIKPGQRLRLYARPAEDPEDESPPPPARNGLVPTLRIVHAETPEGLPIGGLLPDDVSLGEPETLEHLVEMSSVKGELALVTEVAACYEPMEVFFAADLGLEHSLILTSGLIRSMGLEVGQQVVVHRHWHENTPAVDWLERDGARIYSAGDELRE
jgi:hypothetical protein